MSSADRAKGWLFDITAHNHAENLRTNREIQRQAHGLDMQDYPYPGASTVTVTHNYPPGTPAPSAPAPASPAAPPASRSWLLPLLAVAGLAVGAGGVGVGTGLIKLPTSPPVTNPIAPAVLPSYFDEVDKASGKLVQHLRTWPDGSVEIQATDGTWTKAPPQTLKGIP